MKRVKEDNYSWLMKRVIRSLERINTEAQHSYKNFSKMKQSRRDLYSAKQRAVSLGDDNLALVLTNELQQSERTFAFENGYRVALKYALEILHDEMTRKDKDNE